MAGDEKRVLRLLKDHGFNIVRNPRGSHVIWGNGDKNVPVPAKITKRHTANGILKQAGINIKIP